MVYTNRSVSCIQCAAVTSQRLLINEAPHTWALPFRWRLTCHGQLPSLAASPPTIWEDWYGLIPHSTEKSSQTQKYSEHIEKCTTWHEQSSIHRQPWHLVLCPVKFWILIDYFFAADLFSVTAALTALLLVCLCSLYIYIYSLQC